MARKSASVEPEKVQRLSVAELAAHDDVCSDAMIDNAYFKFRIRKYSAKHKPLRGVREDDVPQILLHKVICDKDPAAAEKAMLKLPGIKRYYSGLRSKIVKEHFVHHLRKYIHMYMTDCPWEVSTTNRYTITTYEAAVTSRRRIKQGETIKYLTGTLVPLTTEESMDLDLTNRNFSIVVSSRKKVSSIFLGPARFANHDCDANGRLVTKGGEGMEVIAMKNIEIGDELTVSYGDDYFGPGNIDCLCHTCEVLERNGWSAGSAAESAAESPQGTFGSLEAPSMPLHASEKKRKREAESGPSSPEQRPSKRSKGLTSPSKLHQCWTPPLSSDSEVLGSVSSTIEIPMPVTQMEANTDENDSGSQLLRSTKLGAGLGAAGDETHAVRAPETRQSGSASTRSAKGKRKVDKMTARLFDNASNRKLLPLSPVSSTDMSQADSTPALFQEAEVTDSQTHGHVTIKVENVEKSKLESDKTISIPSLHLPDSIEDDFSQSKRQESSTGIADPGSRVISTLSLTKVTTTIEPDSLPSDANSVVQSIEPATSTTTLAKIMVRPISEYLRVPGDYILTRKLLAQPHDRWIRCHNDKCFGFFVQPNGYQTRRECPRCERHSMLYGFPWPKTDPDPRKLLDRKKEQGAQKKKGATILAASAYRRQGRCGKGTWVEGGGDEEERVMDHRTIHRFVLPEEERELKRRELLNEAEEMRNRGQDTLAMLDGRRVRGSGTESVAREFSESGGSATPEDARRRSNRFVPNRVYADAY